MRSEPSKVGEGREDVGSGGGEERVGSSKVKSGSGKKSSWLVIRVSRVEGRTQHGTGSERGQGRGKTLVCHAWPTTRVAEEGHGRRPIGLRGEWDGRQSLSARHEGHAKPTGKGLVQSVAYG